MAWAKQERMTWKRPRAPWRKSRTTWWFDIPGGIPKAGKGTAGHNCGDDGVFGCGSDEFHVEEAVADVVKIVMRDRRKYGNTRAIRAASELVEPLNAELAEKKRP